jgi:protein phosphatase
MKRSIATGNAPAVAISGITDLGLHRRRNEDAIDWDARLGLAMVADGMGGNQGGDVASVTALRSIKNDLRRALAETHRDVERAQTREVRGSLVAELVRRANHAVRQSAGRDPRLNGMGTTLVMCLVGKDYLTVAHVGDSRLYRLRSEKLQRLTEDHTMVQELVERGDMNARQAVQSRNRNVITRALGINPDVTVDIAHHELEPGDLYMLCSDGLTGMASDTDISAVLNSTTASLDETAKRAIELANARGGRDNVSVVLLKVLEMSHG